MTSKQHHIEFFHRDHFHLNYHRRKSRKSLHGFVDFFWETDFEHLCPQYPSGFADLLFPNVGYTYMVNLGTPFTMQLDSESFVMKSDGFIPRNKNITCSHAVGNKIFGIKFRVSPVVFQKKINFSEYTYVHPLSYLIDRDVLQELKKAKSFEERVAIATAHYESVLKKYQGSLNYISMVTGIMTDGDRNNYSKPVEELAAHYGITPRTLHRNFTAATGASCKQAFKILRLRKALSAFIQAPNSFDAIQFGYFDHSHFFKHANEFIRAHKKAQLSSYTELLNGKGIINYE